MLTAYVDGACSGNPGPAGVGVVLSGAKGKITISRFLGHGTNNIAELRAVQEAVVRSPADQPLVIYTDSQYAIGVLSKGWKANANVPLISEIRSLMKGRDVAFVYVRGHSGVPGNEESDALAKRAILRQSDEVLVFK